MCGNSPSGLYPLQNSGTEFSLVAQVSDLGQSFPPRSKSTRLGHFQLTIRRHLGIKVLSEHFTFIMSEWGVHGIPVDVWVGGAAERGPGKPGAGGAGRVAAGSQNLLFSGITACS